MIFGKVYISPHAINRYRERVLSHKRINDDSDKNVVSRILRDIRLSNTIKSITFGDEYRFVFTKSNVEYRFEKSRDKKSWIMVTCIRHRRMVESEEPISLSDISDKNYGIRTAIRIREQQKEKFDNKMEETK